MASKIALVLYVLVLYFSVIRIKGALETYSTKFEKVGCVHGPTFNISARSKILTAKKTTCAIHCALDDNCSCFAWGSEECFLFLNTSADVVPVTIETGGSDPLGIYAVNSVHEPQCEEITYCPGQGWVRLGGSCYFASAALLSWDDANDACRNSADGAHLVTITTENERTFVLDLIDSSQVSGNWIWIGAHDRVTNGVYVWLNGEIFQWDSWLNLNEPTLHADEDCMMMVTRNKPADTGKFHDYYCVNMYSYVCEIECF